MKSFLLLLLCVTLVTGGPRKLNPVIIVPGDGGSQLEAKITKPTTVAWYCFKETNYWFGLWLNLINLLLPWALNCLVDNMRLVYDNVTRTTSNSPGVDIRVPGFGGTETVEWIDYSHISYSSIFHDMVSAMVCWGYKRNSSVRAAPYDFRKAPNEHGDYLNDFKELIENTYYSNSNTSVVLLAHSMGNPMTLYLLNHMTKTWKDKFIKSFISVSGVWGGAVKSIRLMVSGDDINVPVVSPVKVRREQRSMPSTAWLMPSDEFWDTEEVLVVSPSKNYTIKDTKQLFMDINYTTGYMMWEDTNKLIKPLTAPGVEVHCLHGINLATPGQIVYTKKTWHEGQPKTVTDNGDGTVNIRSLRGCLKFQKQQKQPVHYKVFDKAEHIKILKNADVIKEVGRILTGQPS